MIAFGRALVAGSLVIAMASGCGIKEDFRTPLIIIYNRTLTPVAFDGGWVVICGRTSFVHVPPWPSAPTSPPPGTPNITLDLDLPATHVGEVAVIITDTGVDVVRGGIDERNLPKCAGTVPSPT